MDYNGIIGEEIIDRRPIGGGCIGRSSRIRTASGEFFVKEYSTSGVAGKEADGLRELASAGAVPVPEVIGFDEHVLVLGFINQAPECRDFQARLGRELAGLHRKTSDRFGFYEDNYIGATPQINSYKDSWAVFYLENRLDFQVRLTGDPSVMKAYAGLRPVAGEVLERYSEPPALIHGDLWGGNVIRSEAGEPVLIDPAVYYGHRELELAMTQLFGGFGPAFYKAYDEEYPLLPGWRERQDLYKLYHILNHLNLFGSGYRSQALGLIGSCIKKFK